MRITRTGKALIPVSAAALVFTVIGCNELASASTTSPKPASAAASAPCVADATTLVGKLDDDAYPDKISDKDHTGTKMTVQWGNEDGSFGSPVSMSSLIGVKKGEVGAVAVADFRNKGTLDLLVSIIKPADGDDPGQPRVAEFRPGPLKRSGMQSPDTASSDISAEGEVKAFQIANYNDDDYPDLAILHNGGDGQVNRDVRLSEPDGGLGKASSEANSKYGEFGTEPEPPSMPTDGWSHFYKPCS